MANYPNTLYAPRTKANKSGKEYDPAKTTVIFKEDFDSLENEIKTIETEVGFLPKGTKADVKTRLDDVDSAIATKATQADLNAHTGNTNNPHTVTKAQVSLSDVDNIQQAAKIDFDTHVANQSNPHVVTKTQVGLSDVDNTQQAPLTSFNDHSGRHEAAGADVLNLTGLTGKSLLEVIVATGTTYALTTVANQKVIVLVKGDWTGSASAGTVKLNYNAVQKDVVGVKQAATADKLPFYLQYSETPGAATYNITVVASVGTLANVVMIIIKIT